ncbi:MAG TPA: AraC family transcriptional regulator [Flavitalea sp.]|nr:AraC family transcriptional regulator [Flavitalea sp.]
MVIQSKIKGLNEWLFIENISDTYTPQNSITEKRLAIKKEALEMKYFQLSASGMFLLYTEMKCDDTVKIQTEVSGDTVLSQFIFYRIPSFKKFHLFGRSRHNIRYIPSASHEYEIKKDIEYSYFLMALSKDYYFHLINRHSSLHEDFVTAIDNREYTNFNPIDLQATPEMIRIINELKEGQKKGELRRLHAEAKVMELLIYQLEQLTAEDGPGKATDTYDEEKLEKVRDILDNNFINPPSQKELAQLAALNESKLRKDFKEYFGVTIHNYTFRVRMEYARKLLLEKGKSIFETAELTGFSHQNNFSAAFKKYFGISPSDIKHGS